MVLQMIIVLGFILYWPAILLWQRWHVGRHALIAPATSALQDILESLPQAAQPVSLWLSPAVSAGEGGVTLFGGRMVLPADLSSLDPFLGGLIAHEWAHRTLRHNTITVVYMTCWGLMAGGLFVWLHGHGFWWNEFVLLLFYLVLWGSILTLFPLARHLELAADAYVAQHYPQWAPVLLQYFGALADRPARFVDRHPQPSQRRRALARLL